MSHKPRELHLGRPALRISGLVKDYGRVHAVRRIDLEVRRAEVFGFLGPNGAGKTTTIRCILDLLRRLATQLHGTFARPAAALVTTLSHPTILPMPVVRIRNP